MQQENTEWTSILASILIYIQTVNILERSDDRFNQLFGIQLLVFPLSPENKKKHVRKQTHHRICIPFLQLKLQCLLTLQKLQNYNTVKFNNLAVVNKLLLCETGHISTC